MKIWNQLEEPGGIYRTISEVLMKKICVTWEVAAPPSLYC